MPALIETQFPIARLSAESYKERKGASSQTLPKLGKWWGRKPLILVRASILGMLMPASSNPKRDREIFLKILTMDDAGVWDRCKPAVQRKTSRTAFDLLPYAERIAMGERPENIVGPSPAAWAEINAHLGTQAESLQELVDQLGQRTFGHTPRVGDCFAGGGSIPFEAARIGCCAFGSDLNPVAGLLTWASLNLLGGGKAVQEEVRAVQETVFAAADKQITAWGIEHNDRGERAEAFLYCVEVKPEGCDYYIPLAPSWVISEKYRIVAIWQKVPGSDRLQPTVREVPSGEFILYQEKKGATVVDSRVIDPFDATRSWSAEAMRGSEGLRRWSNDDIIPRPGDVFQERLYCIRWINAQGERRYAAPDAADLTRESRALELLRERFEEWQREGFIPSKSIVAGYNTDQPIRERGWTHWHHLFTPRQLLNNGLLSSLFANQPNASLAARIGGLLGVGSASDFNSRLCRWIPHLAASGGIGAFAQTFYNQALNTLFNWGVRSLSAARTTLCTIPIQENSIRLRSNIVQTTDARDLEETCDFWITDPPYADAVNYHELGDFFLAWYDKQLTKAFPEWISDARAELAVRGDGEDFRRSMVEIYQNLARHMPDNGMQMVMFTHQDPAVWADLGMILWAAGLKATAAWTISTETEAAGIKKGSYVQGTVCLVLRKRSTSEAGFLDEIFPLVEDEVRRQIDSMRDLDEGGEPNFNDADYQLAAYAAALKVLTQFSTIDGRDVMHEVFAVREHGQKSDFQAVIERALGIACDYLVPRGLDAAWRELSLVERYYLRALDIESRGERRKGMYEELARGFGVTDVKPLLKADKANGASMHTASGLEAGLLAQSSGTAAVSGALPARRGRAAAGGPHPFATSPLRHLLFAIRETVAADNNPEPGRQYLRDTYSPAVYWQQRERFMALLEWLAALGNAVGMSEWTTDCAAARLLAGRLRNDQA
jgi:adenine-specific DNA methylase